MLLLRSMIQRRPPLATARWTAIVSEQRLIKRAAFRQAMTVRRRIRWQRSDRRVDGPRVRLMRHARRRRALSADIQMTGLT